MSEAGKSTTSWRLRSPIPRLRELCEQQPPWEHRWGGAVPGPRGSSLLADTELGPRAGQSEGSEGESGLELAYRNDGL